MSSNEISTVVINLEKKDVRLQLHFAWKNASPSLIWRIVLLQEPSFILGIGR